MKIFFLCLFLTTQVFADVCICQYPKEDAVYGEGYKGEIGFYKMGCALWQVLERDCRKRKVMDINEDLTPYLDQHLRSQEKIKLSYVGHWDNSITMMYYIHRVVKPLIDRYETSVDVENTACSSMDYAPLIQDRVASYELPEGVSLNVIGNQTISIGMWDKLLIGYRKADLYAVADSNNSSITYPACETFLNKRCTGFQEGEKGYCTEENKNKMLICKAKNWKFW
jgi:hypothetical protein